MIQKFLKYGATFCAVEFSSTLGSVESYNLLILKKNKKELVIVSKNRFSSFEELIDGLKNQKHIFLIINNQQVLFKKSTENTKNPKIITDTAFPNIKLSEFYYEILPQEKTPLIAICRKEYLHEIISLFNTAKISVIDFSFSVLILQQLIPFIDAKNISTSNAIIQINNNAIEEVKKQDFLKAEYLINDLSVNNNDVLPLAGIIAYFSNFQNTQIGFGELQNILQKKYLNSRFYTLGIKIALGSLFAILLINFIVFSTIHSQMGALNSKLLINNNDKNTLMNLQKRVHKKTKLTNSITSLSSSKTSWYLNEIGKSVPSTLQLTTLIFQPINTPIKEKKRIKVDQNAIFVSGTSKEDLAFSKWIRAMELNNWVEEIIVESYGKGKKSIASFKFVITIKNNKNGL